MTREPRGRHTEWSFEKPAPEAEVLGHVVLRFVVRPQDDDGYFVGECEDFGVSSFGSTVEETLHSTLEATAAYLEGLDDAGERDRIFAEKGVVFYVTAPDIEVDVFFKLHPGEFSTPQRLSQLVDA